MINRTYNPYNKETMTKDELLSELDKLGYEIDKSMSFNYMNCSNGESYKAKACYIVEKDTKLSFSNIDARKDNNFERLQELRFWIEVTHKGRIYEL